MEIKDCAGGPIAQVEGHKYYDGLATNRVDNVLRENHYHISTNGQELAHGIEYRFRDGNLLRLVNENQEHIATIKNGVNFAFPPFGFFYRTELRTVSIPEDGSDSDDLGVIMLTMMAALNLYVWNEMPR